MQQNRRWITLLLSAALGILAILFVFPIVFTLINSFLTEQEIALNYGSMSSISAGSGSADSFINLKLLPDQVSLVQYKKLLWDNTLYLKLFWNSVWMVALIIAGQTAVSAAAAYAFSKLNFRGREVLFLIYVLSMLMPFQVTIVPNYIMAQNLGLLHNPGAIVLPGIFAAFGVFMLRQFMLPIPYAYIEAAKMDGAGHPYIFFKIALPMVKPGIAALIVLLFVDYWNMVEQPLVFLDDPFQQPLSVYLSRINEGDQGVAFAAAVLYMTPMVLLFMYAETYFIEGVQLSGIKG